MELKSINSCINCENLLSDFICKEHNRKVEITNFCESHLFKNFLTKNSSCSNCFHYKKNSCSKPSEASESMLCFDWQLS